MKIVHLVPSMESGGVEQVVMELGSGLSSRGVENIVAVSYTHLTLPTKRIV